MAVNLSKGGRVSLSKEAPGLSKILVGLGWDTNSSDTGAEFDLDGQSRKREKFRLLQQLN